MPSFEIPDSPVQLELRNQAVDEKPFRVAASTFTVTNKTAQALSGRFKIVPQGDAKADWLKLEGEKERPFGPSETQKINVSVSVPGDVPAGEYKFRLVAMNVNDPDNDFTESAVVTFSPPKVVVTDGGGHTPIWPFIAAAVVLVLIVGGYFGYKLLFPGTTTTKPPVASTIAVPNVVTNPTMTFDAARQKLVDAGFTNVSATPVQAPQATGAQPGTVIGQQPGSGKPQPAGQAMTLTVDPGVQIPGNLVGQTFSQAVVNTISSAGLTPMTFQLVDGKTAGVIASTTPSTGPLALKATLTLNISGPRCFVRYPWQRCIRGPMPVKEFMQLNKKP